MLALVAVDNQALDLGNQSAANLISPQVASIERGADRDDHQSADRRVASPGRGGPLLEDVGFAEWRRRGDDLDAIERQRKWRPGPGRPLERSATAALDCRNAFAVIEVHLHLDMPG